MRICLLLSGSTLPGWQADALAHLIEHADAEITTVVYSEYENGRTMWETLKRGLELREWSVATAINRAVRRVEPRSDRVRIDSVIDRTSVRELSVDPNIVEGWKQEIPADVVDDISDDADVAIRFGFGFLVGPILSELEYGVLSYHHGDLREYRGQPMGFWEFVHDRETAGITVQQLTEKLDAGRIAALKTVEIGDLHTWESIRTRLFDESEDVLVAAVQNLQSGDLREADELGDVYTVPTGVPVLKFALKNTRGHVREAF